MKLRKELFDGYILCETIVGMSNYGGRQLNCYVDLSSQKMYFLITCREDNYVSCPYNTLNDAIGAWNKYKDTIE